MKHFLMLLALTFPACATAAEQVHQQDIFVAGTDGYHTYRIPSLIVTAKGTVLAFCEGRKNSTSDTGDIDLLLKRSTDGGNTWSPAQVVWDDRPNTCGNPCPVLDGKTAAICLLLTHNRGELNEEKITAKQGERTVWISRSNDDGKTWPAPMNITASTKDPTWGWYATGPGVGIQIQNGSHKGRLVIPCDHSYVDANGTARGRAVERGAHVIYSDDHGETWRLGGTAQPKMNECQVVELADGKGTLLLSMRSYSGENRRAHSISFDGGLTWTSPESQPQLVDPVCQASILRYNWPKGKEPGRILFSNPASMRRRNMTVRVSYDDGKTWPVGKTLHADASAYSCLSVLPDASIGCLYERGSTNAYEKITFARFQLSWLEGKQ
jgi:sialidase-1